MSDTPDAAPDNVVALPGVRAPAAPEAKTSPTIIGHLEDMLTRCRSRTVTAIAVVIVDEERGGVTMSHWDRAYGTDLLGCLQVLVHRTAGKLNED